MRYRPQAAPLKPDRDELRRLYWDEGLSAEQIGERCAVRKISVLRWMRAAGIERRPAGRPDTLAARGLQIPSAAELERLIHGQHLSYADIAERYGVDFTAVSYWVGKHGIQRPTVWGTRRRGAMPPVPPADDELRRRVALGESMTSIASDVSVPRQVVARRCRELGLTVRRDGWQGGLRLSCSDGHEARSVYEQRVDDWLSGRGIPHTLEPRYPFDKRMRADFLVGETYIEVWGVTHNEAYAQRKARKIALSAEAGIDLVCINHWQFYKGQAWWRPLERLQALGG